MLGNLGMTELLLIFLVVLLVFGAKRIPEIARGMGKGIREFKDATKDVKRELNVDDDYRPTYQVDQPRQQPEPQAPQYQAQQQEAPKQNA